MEDRFICIEGLIFRKLSLMEAQFSKGEDGLYLINIKLAPSEEWKNIAKRETIEEARSVWLKLHDALEIR